MYVMLPLSSGLKYVGWMSKPIHTHIHAQKLIYSVNFDPEDRGNMYLRNVGEIRFV
jgi:hypothetical protein